MAKAEPRADLESLLDELVAVMAATDAAALARAEALRALIGDALEELAKDSGERALEQLGMSDLGIMLRQANIDAVAWAHAHAAELVSNVNATTVDGIRSLVQTALTDGWSNTRLADELGDAFGFSDARAEMIARTETAYADVQGNMIGYRLSGVVEAKEWSTAQSEACPECDALDGMVVPIDALFPGDVDGPPLHPNCRCDVLPVVTDLGAEEAA